MEILLGLAVATVLVIAWVYGNLFACVFLTLGALLVAGFTLLVGGQVAAFGVMAGAAVICGLWAPYYQRRHPGCLRDCVSF